MNARRIIGCAKAEDTGIAAAQTDTAVAGATWRDAGTPQLKPAMKQKSKFDCARYPQ